MKNIFTKRRKFPILVGYRSRLAITGVSMAFELLLAGFAARNIPHSITDLDRLGHSERIGTFNLYKAFATMGLLATFWIQLWQAYSVYIQIACTRFGFLRDALLIWPSKLFNCRLVLHLNGAGYAYFYNRQPTWFQYVIKKTLKQADAIIVLGDSLRQQFAFVPDAKKKIYVVPNSLSFDLKPKSREDKALSRPIHLLFLSNLILSKGYRETLAAVRILHHERGIPIHCDFCGQFMQTATDEVSNPERLKAEFFELIQQWDLDAVVTYHGVVSGRTKEEFLEKARIFILPTTHPWEGQPLSIIEALAFGTPVITTAQGGIPDQVIDRYNGLLVQADPQEIADAIVEMVLDVDFYTMLSRNARLHFEAHFTQETHLDKLIPIILGKHSLPPLAEPIEATASPSTSSVD